MEHFYIAPGAISQNGFISGKTLMGYKTGNAYINVDANFLSNCDPYSCSVKVGKDTCKLGGPMTGGSNYLCNLECKSCFCDKTKNKCYRASTNNNPVIIPVSYNNNRMDISPANGDTQDCITVNTQNRLVLSTEPSLVNKDTCTQKLRVPPPTHPPTSIVTPEESKLTKLTIVTPEESKVTIEGFMQNYLNFAPVYKETDFSQQVVAKNYWF